MIRSYGLWGDGLLPVSAADGTRVFLNLHQERREVPRQLQREGLGGARGFPVRTRGSTRKPEEL